MIFVRLRKGGGVGDSVQQWYEYLVERGAGSVYAFPAHHDANAVLGRLSDRRMLVPPRSLADLDLCLKHTHTVGAMEFKTYLVHFEVTQVPRSYRELPSSPPPTYYWVTGVELSGHVHLGAPSVLGQSVSKDTSAAYCGLPLALRFASGTPPLVLYHGTTADSSRAIARMGMMPGKSGGMLGAGMYFARWDKAATYSDPKDGAIVRCIVFPGPTRVMTEEDVCTCGCAQAFVDHATHHGKGHTTTYVADNSLPATRLAEWCVRDPDVVLVDGIFLAHPRKLEDWSRA
jgi:hypothetical protein